MKKKKIKFEKRKDIYVNLPVRFSVPRDIKVTELARIFYVLGFEIDLKTEKKKTK